MTDTFEVEMADATSVGFLSNDDSPYRCEVCGDPLEYGGRGRKPKFCAKHKKGTTSAPKNSPSMAGLEKAITEMYMGMGMGVSTFVDPTDGAIIINGAEQMAHSWIVLAESNPKFKKFLQKMVTGGGAGTVIVAHMMIALPIMQNHGFNPFAKKEEV